MTVVVINDVEYIQKKLFERAVDIAEHLFQMVDQQTWRDSGAIGPEGQYEGDYFASKVAEEIRVFKVFL